MTDRAWVFSRGVDPGFVDLWRGLPKAPIVFPNRGWLVISAHCFPARRLGGSLLAHRLPAHVDAMGIVNKTIEDTLARFVIRTVSDELKLLQPTAVQLQVVCKRIQNDKIRRSVQDVQEGLDGLNLGLPGTGRHYPFPGQPGRGEDELHQKGSTGGKRMYTDWRPGTRTEIADEMRRRKSCPSGP